jgi:antirestriction protein ArdC
MRRGRAKTTREITSFQQAPYGQKKNPFQPMSIFSEDEIESIHEASLKVLCDTGIDIQSPRAVEILKKAGATIDSDGKRVRFEPGFIMEKIKLFGSFSKYFQALSYTSTLLFHMIPAITDFLRRLPVGDPFIDSFEDPLLVKFYLAFLLIFVVGIIAQIFWLKKQEN